MTQDEKTLRDLMQFAAEGASRIFESKGELRPMWHLQLTNGDNVVMPHPPGTKDQAAAIVREILKAPIVARAVWMAEAWIARTKGKKESGKLEEHAQSHNNSIAEFPGRAEVLWITGEDRIRQLMAFRDITRDANGKPTLGPFKFDDAYKSTEGRMIGMMAPLDKGSAQ